MRKYIAGVLVGLLAMLGSAQFALALPYNCSLRTTTRAVAGYCKSGTGYFRVQGKFRTATGAILWLTSGWKRPGGFSEAYVNGPSGSRLLAGYLQKKA